MKHLLPLAILAILISSPTAAGELKIVVKPIRYQAAQVTHEIVERYIAVQGWCNAPVPTPQAGQIAIYYRFDGNGKCVSDFKVGRATEASNVGI